MKSLLTILISIVPISLWGIYFFFNNPRRQPLKEIAKIFILGLLSIVPVIIFHQSFLAPATTYLASLFHITDLAVLPALLELSLTLVFIIFFVFVFALIQSGVLHFVYHLPWQANFKTVSKKLYNLTPLLASFFILMILEAILSFAIHIDFILSLAGSTILFAVLEEYLKYIINPFLVYQKINSISSAIINTMYVGLAFAFVENILFFANAQGSPDFMTVYIYRSIFTTLLHVCASGVLGYFYGLSLFSESIVTNYEIEKSQYNILVSIRKLIGVRKKSIFQNVTITQGFFVAAIIHATFNFLIFVNLKTLSAVLIIGLTLFIIYLLNSKGAQIQYGLVGSHTMPEEDFAKLRLQISVSQHLKEIQKVQNTKMISLP